MLARMIRCRAIAMEENNDDIRYIRPLSISISRCNSALQPDLMAHFCIAYRRGYQGKADAAVAGSCSPEKQMPIWELIWKVKAVGDVVIEVMRISSIVGPKTGKNSRNLINRNQSKDRLTPPLAPPQNTSPGTGTVSGYYL